MALVFKTPKTAINTTTRNIQNIKEGECPPCPECPECPEVELTTADVEYTENGSFTVTPESGFAGLSQVDITVNIDTQSIADEAYAEGEAAGIVTGKAQGVAEQKAKLTSTTLTTNGTVTREDGWNEVTVNVDTTTPYNEGVAAGIAEQKAKLTATTITENGTTTREDGFNSVTVNVQPDLETKTASYNANGQYTITPTTGKDGISEATVTVNVPSDVNNQDKTVTPTTSSQSVTADSGYSGLGTVTVNGVTSAIDQNITAGNIKSGVTILGVTGTVTEGITPTGNINITNTDSTDVTNYATAQVVDANLTAGNIKSGTTILGVQGSYDPQPDLETKSVTYTANDTYTITPTTGKDGLSSVEVTVNVSGGGSSCPDWSSIDWTCSDVTTSGLADEVAYTASVKDNNSWTSDSNLVFAPKTSTSSNSGLFKNCNNLRYVGNLTLTSNDASFKELFRSDAALRYTGTISAVNATSVDATSMFESCSVLKNCTVDMANVTDTSYMFQGCFELTNVTFINNPVGKLVNTQRMYSNCRRLSNVPLFDTSNVTNMSYMFQNMEYKQGLIDTVSQFDTSSVTDMAGMFWYYSTTPGTAYFTATSAPSMDTSSVVNASDMFQTVNNTKTKWLVTIPQYDFSSVANTSGFVKYQGKLENLGGFLNLGKSFISTDYATWHILDLSASTVLTKQSIMNVINNLAAPEDTTVVDATLKLSATSYALLDASDIAIATEKGWSVISA